MSDDIVFQHELDARGLLCPEPVMLLHKVVRQMAAGEVVRVLATDPSTTRDVPQFCRFLGHALLAQQEAAGEYRYFIRRKD